MLNSEFGVINILLVEDNLGDIRLAEEALKEYDIKVKLDVVMDGEEAIDYLKKRGGHKDAVTPHLVLLDLNLPKRDGRSVLAEIKNDDDLRRIPTIVLTISNSDLDIKAAYNSHANCYIVKPLDFNKFIDVIRQTIDYWFKTVRLPN